MNQPLVSIVVLNYRRRPELVRTLESVCRQTYQPLELLVVDNHSGDDTADFLAKHFPQARILALDQNLGCGGRNRGILESRGELVVTLDNDVRFDSPSELEAVARAFHQNPAASVLVFKVLDDATGRLHLRDWCHPRSFAEFADRPFESYYIAEGACAFRREHFLQVGGYYEPFLIGGEGWDLALRMLDAGLSIFYCPEVRVRHSMAQETRSGRRPYYYLTRNYIWTAYKDYVGWRRGQYLCYGLLVMSFFCLRTGNLRELFWGIREGMRGRPALPFTPISERGWNRVSELKGMRPNLWKRLLTHWAQPEI